MKTNYYYYKKTEIGGFRLTGLLSKLKQVNV